MEARGDDVQERITGFWDIVAPGYDEPSNVAAPGSDGYRDWNQALRTVLPPPPARVLDVVMNRSLNWTLRDLDIAFRNWFQLLVPGGRAIAIYGLTDPAGALETDATNEDPAEQTDVFSEHYTPATRAGLEAQVDRHDRLHRAALAAGFDDVRVTALEVVRGWEVSPGSICPTHSWAGARDPADMS